jgi:hypothetical protein
VGPTEPLDPVCVLLLPVALEEFTLRAAVERLRRARGVVAVDPPRVSYASLARLPAPVVDALAASQGRRLVRSLRRRVGEPRVVVVFAARQYALARGVLGLCAGSELWYWRAGAGEDDEHDRELDALAAERARLVAVGADADFEPLWAGLEQAGVDVRPK